MCFRAEELEVAARTGFRALCRVALASLSGPAERVIRLNSPSRLGRFGPAVFASTDQLVKGDRE